MTRIEPDQSLSVAKLDQHLKEAYKPANRVILRLGSKGATAFDCNFDSTIFYHIYAYYFYNNDWIERMIDTYFLYDLHHGERVFRVNQDGFKSEERAKLQLLQVLKGAAGLDVCMQVVSLLPGGQPNSLLDYQMHYMLSPQVQRIAVEEISLRFSDTFVMVLQKTFNLQTTRTAYTLSLRIDIPQSAAESILTLQAPPGTVLLPTAALIIRIVREIECIVAHTRAGGQMDAPSIMRIAKQCAESQPATK